MEFFNKIVHILQKPFHDERNKLEYTKGIAMVSLFVILFLYTFQPFGISTIPSGKFLICLGFGGITFIASITYEFLIRRPIQSRGAPKQFTFGKWILTVIGVMLFISFANFFFARILFGDIQWAFLPPMIFGTFTVGIFPIVVLGGISLFKQEKKYQIIAAEINQKEVRIPDIIYSNDLTIFDIPTSQIKYIEALQNYVKIGYINADAQLTEQTERVTLKRILNEAKGSSIVKCHRSFLVNHNTIISVSGNAQGLLLSLSGCDKKIPVSRSYVATFREF